MSVTRLLARHFFFQCKIKSETTGKRTGADISKKKKMGIAKICIGETFQPTKVQYFLQSTEFEKENER